MGVVADLSSAVGVDLPRPSRRRAECVDVLHRIVASSVALSVPGASTGSGVVVMQGSRNTHVLTCAHVVGNAERMEVIFRSGETRLSKLNAVVEHVDTDNDLALVRTARRMNADPIVVATDEPEIYERAFVVGSPGGLFGTAADALICSTNGHNGHAGTGYQFTGLSVPGISGGALANYEGELLGIVSNVKTEAHLPVWNIGFAVPLPKIHEFLRMCGAKQKKG